MNSYLSKFKSFCVGVDSVPSVPEKPVQQPLRAKLYKLVKIMDGVKRDVAFGLTIFEAKTLKNHAKRCLVARGPNVEGNTKFEITEVLLEEQI